MMAALHAVFRALLSRSQNTAKTAARQVFFRLTRRRSCKFTGGGVSRRIVSVPGASEVYFEGLNTYDERSKIKRLGVSEYTLKTVGAVSD